MLRQTSVPLLLVQGVPLPGTIAESAMLIDQVSIYLRSQVNFMTSQQLTAPVGLAGSFNRQCVFKICEDWRSPFKCASNTFLRFVSAIALHQKLQLDIRELAPLYTSLFAPYHLQIAGKLHGTETAISEATQIFAGR
ncbi:sterol carrier protein domain-containing protein [Nostoc sp.]|uniref:sterol carrier protein domain-containing protein n=1 Tax=Nostoc sp. TaxID=1180 RepID=UPI003FA60C0B